MCDGVRATIVGTAHSDVIQGTPHADVIAGLGGDDIIDGLGGNDRICGGDGSDHLAGDGGHDLVRGGSGYDQIDGGGGHDHLFGGAGRDGIFSVANGIVHGGAGNDRITEFKPHSRVYGDDGRDALVGWLKAGSRQVIDGGGDDNSLSLSVRLRPTTPQTPWQHVTIDLSRDKVTLDGHLVRIVGTFYEASVRTGRSALYWTFLGTSHANHFAILGAAPYPVAEYGRGGDDSLSGGNGDDLLDGGSGFDKGDGGRGTDTCLSIEAPQRFETDTHCEQ